MRTRKMSITEWLTNWREGDREASERLFAVVYPELRRIAARFLQNERGDHTLEPTALVNEMYLRLFGSAPISFQDRAHFFAIAAQTMRRILIDYARATSPKSVAAGRSASVCTVSWRMMTAKGG